jgi:hypothetical protein
MIPYTYTYNKTFTMETESRYIMSYRLEIDGTGHRRWQRQPGHGPVRETLAGSRPGLTKPRRQPKAGLDLQARPKNKRKRSSTEPPTNRATRGHAVKMRRMSSTTAEQRRQWGGGGMKASVANLDGKDIVK